MSGGKGITFKVADLIGLFNFHRCSHNKVDNVGILVLWRDLENLYYGNHILKMKINKNSLLVVLY